MMLRACWEICLTSYHANANRVANAISTISRRDIAAFSSALFINSRFSGALDGLSFSLTNGTLSMLRQGREEIHFSASKSSVLILRARMGPVCYELARSGSSLCDSGVRQEPRIHAGGRLVAGHRHWSEYVDFQHCQCTPSAATTL